MAERYFTLINIILITAFVGLSTNTFYKVVTRTMVSERVQAPKETAHRNTRQASAKTRSLASYSMVAKRDLFKVAVKETAPSTEIPTDVKDTTLQLTLWGTISSDSPTAWAVIEDKKTRKQSLYKVGDVIQNATLTHVLRNEVILNLNGENQSLKVEDVKNAGSGRSPMPPPRDIVDQGPDEEGAEAKKITVERTMIDESLKDINKLMKDVRIRPHFKDGQPDGLIVSGIRGDSVFKQLGLRNGDIIMGVDGNKIESVDDAMKLYGGLKNMENMKVEIKRRGQLQTLDFDIK